MCRAFVLFFFLKEKDSVEMDPEIQEEVTSCEAQHVALGILEAEERERHPAVEL